MKTLGVQASALFLVVGLAAAGCNVLTGADGLRIAVDGDGGAGGDTTAAVGSGGGPTGLTTSSSSSSSSSSTSNGGATTSSSSSSSTSSTSSSSSSSTTSSSGGEVCDYPTGTTGVHVGQTIKGNLAWQGYAAGSTQLSTISIQDYFDCDGTKGVNALLILQSATWCGVCQDEASGLNAEAASWESKGIRVLTLMIEDINSNPASTQTALQWKNTFGLSKVAVAADPNFSFAPGGSAGLPMNILVDPRTMKIKDVEEGWSGDYSAVLQLAQQNAN